MVGLVGASSGLERERRQAALVIPTALLRELRGLLTGHVTACCWMVALIARLAAATGGYVAGLVIWLAPR